MGETREYEDSGGNPRDGALERELTHAGLTTDAKVIDI